MWAHCLGILGLFACGSVVFAYESASDNSTASLHGIVSTATGTRVAATLKAHPVTGGADQSTDASRDGNFAILNLPPGRYSIMATKQGFASSSVSLVNLSAGQSLNLNLTLGPFLEAGGFRKGCGTLTPTTGRTRPAADQTPRAAPWHRVSTRRRFQTPTGPYGGSPDIGAPDTNVPLLMQALYGGSHGKARESGRVKVYGWLED